MEERGTWYVERGPLEAVGAGDNLPSTIHEVCEATSNESNRISQEALR